jgi:predicted DNA-binding protein
MTDKKDRMFCVRVDKELIKRFKAACDKANKKTSEFVREYMELTAIKYGL